MIPLRQLRWVLGGVVVETVSVRGGRGDLYVIAERGKVSRSGSGVRWEPIQWFSFVDFPRKRRHTEMLLPTDLSHHRDGIHIMVVNLRVTAPSGH